MMNRRNFVKLSAAGIVGSSLVAWPRAMATHTLSDDDKFFVLLRMIGGWDVTLGLDPWIDEKRPANTDMFIEYRPEEVIKAGESLYLGPSAAVMAKYGSEIAIVNGVIMSEVDNGHNASLSYASNASSDSSAPNLPIEIEVSTRESMFGVISNQTLEQGSRTAQSAQLSDLRLIPTRPDAAAILNSLVDVILGKSPFAEGLRAVIDGKSDMHRFKQALAMYGDPENVTDAQTIAAAFQSGTARTAMYDVLENANLDTHAQHEGNHLRVQASGWAAIDSLFQLFKSTQFGTKGDSLFDRTTFMVVSEFSRTPALNSSAGKDHNPLTNSVLLAGRGVRGGQSFGASRLVTAAESKTKMPYHIGYPIDFATGEVLRTREAKAAMIRPDHIGQTVATILGVDRARFRSVPNDVKALNWLIKS